MNDNRHEGQDMLEDIIEDLSRENEFGAKDEEARPDEPRRTPPPQKNTGKLWLAVIAAIVVLGATWYIFKGGAEPESPTPPASPAALENGAASQSETLFPPSGPEPAEAAESTTPAPETAAANTNAAGQPVESSSEALRLAEEERAKAEEAARLAAEAKAKAEAEAKAKLEAEAKAKAEAEAKAKLDAEEKAKAETAAAAPETPAATTPAATADAAQPEEAAAAPIPISGLWVVNISSTPDSAESLAILTKVMASDAGGRVYAYETTVEGKKQHRIRVGFFATREEAEAVGQKLQETHKLPSAPWAVQPNVEEVERYSPAK